MIRMYKYSSEGYSLIMVDGRDADIPRFRKRRDVHALCLLNEADGLAIVCKSAEADYALELYDAAGAQCEAPDGPLAEAAERCSVAYADLLGVKAFHSVSYRFVAPGGAPMDAEILSHLGECKIVRLGGASDAPTLCEGDMID